MQFHSDITPGEHDAFVSSHAQCNLLQSALWERIKTNWNHVFVGVKEHGELIASAMILIRKLPMRFTMFYIPRGPVMDYEDKELVRYMMAELKHFAHQNHGIMITFDPALHVNDFYLENANEEHYSNIRDILNTLQVCGAHFKGFTKNMEETIQPRYHACVYAEDFVQLQSRTLKKARRTMERKHMEIMYMHEEGVDDFTQVMRCTEKRKHIHLRSSAYYTALMKMYQNDAIIILVCVPVERLLQNAQKELRDIQHELDICPDHAKKKRFTMEEKRDSLKREVHELTQLHAQNEGRHIAAGALCVRYGNTAELLYAGMDERYKRYMAPYICFESCMKWSFDKGCAWCNMGGVEGNLSGGLIQFKANFQPKINEFIGEFDLPVNHVLYKIVSAYLMIRGRRIHKKQG